MTFYSEYEIEGPLYDDDPNVQECQRCPNKCEINNLRACIDCGIVLCSDCVRHFGFEDYCQSCAICNFCSNEASYYCEMCSDLICPDHVREVFEVDAESGYREMGKRCCGCR